MKKPISKKTGPESEQFQLRLPDGMRKQLAKVAEREGRSMNVVVVTALMRYFEHGDAASAPKTLDAALQGLIDQMEEGVAKLIKQVK